MYQKKFLDILREDTCIDSGHIFIKLRHAHLNVLWTPTDSIQPTKTFFSLKNRSNEIVSLICKVTRSVHWYRKLHLLFCGVLKCLIIRKLQSQRVLMLIFNEKNRRLNVIDVGVDSPASPSCL